jgi:hypothetical protein
LVIFALFIIQLWFKSALKTPFIKQIDQKVKLKEGLITWFESTHQESTMVSLLNQQISDQLKEVKLEQVLPWSALKNIFYFALSTLLLIFCLFAFRADFLMQYQQNISQNLELLTYELYEGPLLADLKITIHPPSYSNQQPQTLDASSGDFEALEGSEIEFFGKSIYRIQEATFFVLPQQISNIGKTDHKTYESHEMEIMEQDGQQYLKLKWKLGRYQKWKMAVHSEEGRKYIEKEDKKITLMRDFAPKVKLLSPEKDLTVDGQKNIDVLIEGQDDFGLSYAQLLLNICCIIIED